MPLNSLPRNYTQHIPPVTTSYTFGNKRFQCNNDLITGREHKSATLGETKSVFLRAFYYIHSISEELFFLGFFFFGYLVPGGIIMELLSRGNMTEHSTGFYFL